MEKVVFSPLSTLSGLKVIITHVLLFISASIFFVYNHADFNVIFILHKQNWAAHVISQAPLLICYYPLNTLENSPMDLPPFSVSVVHSISLCRSTEMCYH